MAKLPKRQYVCQQCGATHSKWLGRCESCEAWNSLVEETPREHVPKGLGAGKGRPLNFHSLEGASTQTPRLAANIAEFDRVTGGGLVPGSATLIGGDPGIGKSTVLLQVAAALSTHLPCAYISGEESVDQLRMRADRLGLAAASVDIAAATDVRHIVTTMDGADPPRLLVVDSIQTMFIDSLDSAPGTVAQLRGSAQELIRAAKRHGIALVLVGHVTKDGVIAGPRVLEHMVDTVLYFEGDRGHQFRILRAVKNRFGATDEIGVFEMSERGLIQVTNPSALFLGDRDDDVSGASVFAGIEGSRPMLVEIQSLIAPSDYGTPRRAVVGWDQGRLAMILAVLDARCGVSLAGNDVYLNVAGGLRISEPAADLAVAAALLSSLWGKPLPRRSVVYGEIGLSGRLRRVGQADSRLKEAEKLGFSHAIIPPPGKKNAPPAAITATEIATLADLVALFGDLETGPQALAGAAHG